MKNRASILFLLAQVWAYQGHGQQLTAECEAKCYRAGMSTGVTLLGICSAQVDFKRDADPQAKAECTKCLEETCRPRQSEEARLTFPTQGTEIGAATVFRWTKGYRMVRYRLLVGTSRGEGNLYTGELTTLESPPVKIPAGHAGKSIWAWLSSFDGTKWLTAQPVEFKTQPAGGLLDRQERPPLPPQNRGQSLEDYFGLPPGSNTSQFPPPMPPVQQPGIGGSWVSQDGATGMQFTAAPGQAFSGSFRFSQTGLYGTIQVQWSGREYTGRYETRDRSGRVVSRGTQRLIVDGNRLMGPWRDDNGMEGFWILYRSFGR